ncbi:MAG: aspartate racemase, partial [Lachnospiraceae bacterium]|nr:aspartate racemase [Lachnospiraceae bacterium]
EELFADGAETLVLGCTELPVAFDLFQIEKPNIDPTLVLAKAAVRFVGARVKGD